MRILFIINPAAGAHRAQTRWAAFAPQLPRNGIQADHLFTACPGDAASLARKTAGDYDLLVAVGGDGTASEVAQGILTAEASRAALGILAFGTGNDVAGALDLGTEADSIRSLIRGQTRSIDVIEVHCQAKEKPTVRYALLFAGVGIICESLRKTTRPMKRLLGQRMAYPAGLVVALWNYHSPRMTITCDAQAHDGHFLFVGASNTERAGGGMKIAPGARIDDGLLNVNLIGAVGRWQALKQLRRLCRGQHTTHPNVRYLTTRSLKVDTDTPLEVAADGDLIGYTPARFIVRPKALPVRVP